jgi:hypothetical protein
MVEMWFPFFRLIDARLRRDPLAARRESIRNAYKCFSVESWVL